MLIDGVFSGGGMKAVALVGALQVLEEEGYRFHRTAGTSAGALVAALLASGYDSRGITEILNETEFQQLLDARKSVIPFPFMKWIRVYKKLGMHRGEALEKWVRRWLRKKGVDTFADLPRGALKIVASDLSRGRILVLPDDLPQYGVLPEKFSVARAVRMSSSLPFIYEPVLLYDRNGDKNVIVDGGVLSNFPLWLFDNAACMLQRPVLGLQLSHSLENQKNRNIRNAVELYHSLFSTMKQAHDARYISKHEANNIVFIPVSHVSTTQFHVSDEEREQLIALGRERAEKFLKKWRY
ncbi:MAG TPA: patatin-like phospholipase family protein [Bacillales bacterium]|nr:patatin-like phospholipase family protein [Bacillales bacterium]